MSIRKTIRKFLYNRRLKDLPKICKASSKGHASHGQDEFVAGLLSNVKQGVFVEVGANDGITMSNTYYLEKELGWTGLAIEPIPSAFKKLSQNRECVTVHGCITNFDGETPFLEITGDGEMLSGIPDNYDEGQARRVRKNLRRHNATSRKINVPCYRLTTLLERHGIDHINYLSLDTEGGEMDILRSIDFGTVNIDVLSVENNSRDSAVEDLLRTTGYDLIAIGGVDEIFKREALADRPTQRKSTGTIA